MLIHTGWAVGPGNRATRVQIKREDVLEWEDVQIENEAIDLYKRTYGRDPVDSGHRIAEEKAPSSP